MQLVELYLYAGFAVGWLFGRWRPSHGPWASRATVGTVVVLLGLLGASFRGIAPRVLAGALPLAAAFAVLVLGMTAAVYLALAHLGPRPTAPDSEPAAPERSRVPTSAVLLAALLTGYLAGQGLALPTDWLIPAVLTVLLALIGYGIQLDVAGVRRAWVPITAAAAGSLLAALAFTALARLPLNASLAAGLGFGWYSLTGPLVAARLGAGLGLLAFAANFLRETLTMVLAPVVGRRVHGEGLAALGGATAMDTTLYFVVRYGDRRAGALAVASGLTLTIAAGLLVPLVLAL